MILYQTIKIKIPKQKLQYSNICCSRTSKSIQSRQRREIVKEKMLSIKLWSLHVLDSYDKYYNTKFHSHQREKQIVSMYTRLYQLYNLQALHRQSITFYIHYISLWNRAQKINSSIHKSWNFDSFLKWRQHLSP